MVEHDLTPEELKELIRLTPKGKSSWSFANLGDRRIYGPRITHDGEQITTTKSHGRVRYVNGQRLEDPDDSTAIVRAVYNNAIERRDKRSEAAKRAAKTRAKRKALKIDRIAKHWMDSGQLEPGKKCCVCGKPVTDPQSEARGIGSDCWQQVLRKVEHLKTSVSVAD